MADAATGEIRMWAGVAFIPSGWALCDGRTLNISDYNALFSLLGATYGGNGTTTFALPDMRGRIPVGQGTLTGGQTYTLGGSGGTETVTLTAANLPLHTHTVYAGNADATSQDPGGRLPAIVHANGVTDGFYIAPADGTAASAHAYAVGIASPGINPTQAVQGHENMMPTFAINFIICLNGIYPDRP